MIALVALAAGCGGGGGGGGPDPQVGSPGNAKPVADAILAETPKDTALVLTLHGTDADGQALSFAIVAPPKSGSLGAITPIAGTPADSASVTYTPDPGATGVDHFTYVASDGRNDSTVATVTIAVDVHLVLGAVDRFDGQPYVGLPVEFIGTGASTGQDFSEVTDADGAYVMALPKTWTGNIDSTGDYRFVPPFRTVAAAVRAMAGHDFAASRDFHVDIHDPDATDAGDGTEAVPFASLAIVQGLVDPGDTVWVHGGTYVSLANRMVEVSRGGRPGAPVTWAAVPGEKVLLDVNHNQDCFHVVGVTNVVIRGFEVKNARRDAFRIQGSADCLFEDNIVHDCVFTEATSGIRLREACERMTIRGNEVYRCSVGIVSGPPFGARAGIVIEGNYVHDLEQGLATEIGIAVVETQGTIRNNVVARCEGAGIEASLSDVLVEGNVVYNCGGIRPANGLVLAGSPSLVARRNASFNNAGHGFVGAGTSWEHNVAFGNGFGGLWVLGTQTLRNTIAYKNNQSGGFSDVGGPGAFDSDANFWADGAFPVGEGPNSLSGDPEFVLPPAPGAALDPGDPGFGIDPSDGGFGDVSALFGLAAGSPAVDAGIDVGLPFNGLAPDMGAFERP
jgi:hypothetical protein